MELAMTSQLMVEATPQQVLQVERLEALVQRRLGSRVRDFRILPRPDGVIIQGRAATYHAKQIAQHAVMEITNQHIVANDIEVC
jgi:hypothetical protein